MRCIMAFSHFYHHYSPVVAVIFQSHSNTFEYKFVVIRLAFRPYKLWVKWGLHHRMIHWDKLMTYIRKQTLVTSAKLRSGRNCSFRFYTHWRGCQLKLPFQHGQLPALTQLANSCSRRILSQSMFGVGGRFGISKAGGSGSWKSYV